MAGARSPKSSPSFDEQLATGVGALLDQYSKLKKDEFKRTGEHHYDDFFQDLDKVKTSQIKDKDKREQKLKELKEKEEEPESPKSKDKKFSKEEIKEMQRQSTNLTRKMLVIKDAVNSIREFQSLPVKDLNGLAILARKIQNRIKISKEIPHSSARARAARFFKIDVDSKTTKVLKKIDEIIQKELGRLHKLIGSPEKADSPEAEGVSKSQRLRKTSSSDEG